MLHNNFEKWVKLTPQSPAIICTNGTIVSYGELDRIANTISNNLTKEGVTPGNVVGICAERSPLMIAGLLGIVKSGT